MVATKRSNAVSFAVIAILLIYLCTSTLIGGRRRSLVLEAPAPKSAYAPADSRTPGPPTARARLRGRAPEAEGTGRHPFTSTKPALTSFKVAVDATEVVTRTVTRLRERPPGSEGTGRHPFTSTKPALTSSRVAVDATEFVTRAVAANGLLEKKGQLNIRGLARSKYVSNEEFHQAPVLTCPSKKDVCCAGWDEFMTISRADRKEFARTHSAATKRATAQLPAGKSFTKPSCKRILLIVVYNWVFYSNVPRIKKLYGDVFTDVVFYGPDEDKGHGVFSVDLQNGFLFHRAIARAIAAFPGYDGYFWAGDDVFINYPMLLSSFSPNAIWINLRKGVSSLDKTHSQGVPWVHWDEGWGLQSVQSALQCMKPSWLSRRESRLGCASCVAHGLVDFGYVPASVSVEFAQCLYTLWETIMELAIQTCQRLIADGSMRVQEFVGEINVWRKGYRTAAWLDAHEFNNTPAVHPIKLSNPAHTRMMHSWLKQSQEYHAKSPKFPICHHD